MYNTNITRIRDTTILWTKTLFWLHLNYVPNLRSHRSKSLNKKLEFVVKSFFLYITSLLMIVNK